MSEPRSDAATALAWWNAMQPSAPDGGDRAAAARLRRCATVTEAMQEPATLELFRRLGRNRPEDLPAVALLAAVLAHVRQHVGGAPFARAVGPQPPDEAAAISALRFRRLLQAQSHDELLTAFRRTVALAGDKANVTDLARALLRWDEATRRRWIFDYWNAAERDTSTAPAA